MDGALFPMQWNHTLIEIRLNVRIIDVKMLRLQSQKRPSQRNKEVPISNGKQYNRRMNDVEGSFGPYSYVSVWVSECMEDKNGRHLAASTW